MPLKVCLAVHRFPPHIGGCEKYAYNLASGLSERGIQVTVYTSRTYRYKSMLKQNFQIREFDAIKFPRSGYFLWLGAFNPRVIGKLSEFDIFHAVDVSMFSPMIGIMRKKIYGAPAVLTCTYHPPYAMIHKNLKMLYDNVVGRCILDEYDVLIVHSEYERETLKRHFPHVNLRKIRKIPHGLRVEKSKVSFRSEYSLKDDFLVLCAGRIDSHKGIAHALEAVKLLVTHNTIENLHIVMLGEEESWYKCPISVKRLIEDLGSRIVFAGKVPPEILASAYAESDVALLTSKYETFSYIVLEALSYGTPVISTKVGIAPELIRNGFNGFLYNYGDVHDLAQKIEFVHKEVENMKSLATQTVRDLTLDKEIEQTIDVYKSVLEQKS